MKFKLIFSILLCLSWFGFAAAETTMVNLWSDPQGKTIGTSWSDAGYVIIKAADAAKFAEGDVLTISVSDINTECANPQILLQRAWGNFNPSQTLSLKDKEAPIVAKFPITAAMIDELANEGASRALQVKGLGFTMKSIDLEHNEAPKSGETATVSLNLWEGIQTCTDGWGGYLKLTPDQIGSINEGNVIEIYVSEVSPTSSYPQVVIQTGKWTDFNDCAPFQLKDCELPLCVRFTVTQSMASLINNVGLIVKGCGYTFSSVNIKQDVDLYDNTDKPMFLSEINKSDVRVYMRGESPTFGFTLRGLHTSDINNLPVSVKVLTDQGDKIAEYHEAITLKARAELSSYSVVIPESSLVPGFYRINAVANNVPVGSFTIGYDPLNIENPTDALPDFRDYWDTALANLKTIDPQYKIEEIPEASSTNRRIYKVSMYSTPDEVGGTPVIIRGYYAEPVQAGQYPVLIQYQGTDSGSGDVSPMKADDNPGWCEFILSTRGQKLNRVEDPDSWKKYGGDFYSYGLMDFHSHYYRNAYLDCVRAVDFICSRQKADDTMIFATGASQGGSFCYAAAALDNRITAIAPAITGHSDFKANVNIVSWPANKFDAYLQNNPHVTRDQFFDFLSYYDVKNLAPYVTCPIITAFSLQDPTDPPRGNIAPFNVATTPDEYKEYIVNPFLGHTTHSSWANDYMQFFDKFKKISTGTDIVDITENLSLKVDSRCFRIDGAEKIPLSIFSMMGDLIQFIPEYSSESITIPHKGIYIITVGQTAFKVII